jgi:plasmid stabilization system protein ParE
MTPVVVVLPDELKAFLDAELAAKGFANAGAYLCALLADARTKAISARLDTLLRKGLAGDTLPLGQMLRDGLEDSSKDPFGTGDLEPGTQHVFVRQAASDDIRREHDRYSAQGMPAIARRFLNALARTAETAKAMPATGTACPVTSAELAGACSWPMKGFSEHRLYGILQEDRLTLLRVLHDKRDIEIQGPVQRP